MASMIENSSKDSVCSVISLLVVEGRQPIEIYTRIKDVYGDYGLFSYGSGRMVQYISTRKKIYKRFGPSSDLPLLLSHKNVRDLATEE